MPLHTAVTWSFALALIHSATGAAGSESPKLKKVTARAITLQVPESWRRVKTTSQMRIAQFEIPGRNAEEKPAELVVYYFGGPTGGVKLNLERWIGQFDPDGRKVEVARGRSQLGSYILADISGTWKRPIGPPIMQKTVSEPGSRVIGVILIAELDEGKDYYFLKLSGPDALVRSQTDALRRSMGAERKSEKPYQLSGAENRR
jgi:gluconolactonase